jgi:hypothetical protein
MIDREMEFAHSIANQQASAIAALNGVVSILIYMAKRRLITEAELAGVHESMSKPFTMPHLSDNPLAQDSQQHLDGLLSEVQRFLKDGPLPPEPQEPKKDE